MPGFVIGSPEHFFSHVVIPQHRRFVESNSDVGAAVCAIVMTYHLYEWATGETFQRDSFPVKYPNDLNLLELFDLARRVTNGVKHAKPKIETVSQSGFSSAFSSSFSRPLNIVQNDGSKVSVDELLDTMIEFWTRQQQAGWPNAPT